MSERLPSSADRRLQSLKREITLQIYLKDGPFWDAIRALRERWKIQPEVRVPGDGDRRLPPIYDRVDLDALEEAVRLAVTRPWYLDLAKLHDAIVPPELQVRASRRISLASWSTFLAACVLCDPPETELLEFAALGHLPSVSFGNLPLANVNIETWTVDSTPDTPAMFNPPIVDHPDPRVAVRHERWLWREVIAELGRRYLAPHGIDVDAVVQAILHEQGLLEAYLVRGAAIPLQKLIAVESSTTEEDVHRAIQMIAATQPERSKGGRPPIDPLVAVQCAVLKRQGWTDRAIAERFNWSLRPDSYDQRRRSNQVVDHVKRGREILAGRKNPAE